MRLLGGRNAGTLEGSPYHIIDVVVARLSAGASSAGESGESVCATCIHHDTTRTRMRLAQSASKTQTCGDADGFVVES